MAIEPTIWTQEQFRELSEPARLLQVIREQVIPYEAEQRVRLAGGMARRYYVFGRPKTGGMAVVKDSEGVNVVTDRILLGEFETEEEAQSFRRSLDRRIAEASSKEEGDG